MAAPEAPLASLRSVCDELEPGKVVAASSLVCYSMLAIGCVQKNRSALVTDKPAFQIGCRTFHRNPYAIAASQKR